MDQIFNELRSSSNINKSKILTKFFQTHKGGYGEGDQFLGVTVPIQRQIAKKYYDKISLTDLKYYISNPFHECRLTAIFILVNKFQKSIPDHKKEIYHYYIDHLKNINNWDLVDSSADKIIGAYLFDKEKNFIYELSKSKNLWYQRISIISTFHFIRKNQFDDTLTLSKHFLNHEHDLIHKAVGWMLREIGKINYKIEYNFLKSHYLKMPRTMLRYAIEKFPESTRQNFLKGNIK
jgi:3-methyladenine DNA glycosylase AlkD